VPWLLNGDTYVGALPPQQRQAKALARIDTFGDVWNAALVLFGLHLVVIGYLAVDSYASRRRSNTAATASRTATHASITP